MEKQNLDHTLSTLCKQQAPVTVISVESGGIYRGRFKTLSQERITIDLPECPAEVEFPRFSQCACLFRHGNGGCVFLASVDLFQTSGILVIQRPEDAACESRRSSRVAVSNQRAQVEMKGENGEIFQAYAVDLSVTGALVEFPGEEVPELPVGRRFKVKIRLEELSVELDAEVRRRYGDQYGLVFSEFLAQGQPEPPPELSELVHRLEQGIFDQARLDQKAP